MIVLAKFGGGSAEKDSDHTGGLAVTRRDQTGTKGPECALHFRSFEPWDICPASVHRDKSRRDKALDVELELLCPG